MLNKKEIIRLKKIIFKRKFEKNENKGFKENDVKFKIK